MTKNTIPNSKIPKYGRRSAENLNTYSREGDASEGMAEEDVRQPDMRIRVDRDHPDHPLSSEMVITVAGVERLRNMPHTSSILCD